MGVFLEIIFPIKCHFLLWGVDIKQDDGVGLNVKRDSSLKIYANGKKSATQSLKLSHTHSSLFEINASEQLGPQL